MQKLQDAYNKFTEMGIPAEDARYVLPNAAETKIVCTFNARSLLNFFSLRCCMRAQWEIRACAAACVRSGKSARWQKKCWQNANVLRRLFLKTPARPA